MTSKQSRPALSVRVGFIGLGRMGGALARGAVASGVLRAARVGFVDADAAVVRRGRQSGFRLVRSTGRLVSWSDIVFLCVKPQQMIELLEEIRSSVPEKERRRVCFVSIAAGITLATLERRLGPVAAVRVMPNTPAMLNAGVSAFSRGQRVSARRLSQVQRILESVGTAQRVPEKWMDAVTAVSGSGPAYVFYLAEGLARAARRAGLPASVADRFARETVIGAGRMLAERPESPEELRRGVTSPGGTTASAIAVLENKKWLMALEEAVRRAKKRSEELSRLAR